MKLDLTSTPVSRRTMLRASVTFAGGALLTQIFPSSLARAAFGYAQQKAAPADAVAAQRAMFNSAPMKKQKLADRITLLSGPGGNVVVFTGPDGDLMVDTFVQPAWPRLQMALADLGAAHLKTVINSHWHFDHTDNNGPLHAAGATVLAHVNTQKRMSESHDLAFLGLHFPPRPVAERPQHVFQQTDELSLNGQNLLLRHLAPAHTDTDVCIHFQEANVLHTGDVFFNGVFPYIDKGTGGSLAGMIASSGKLLTMADAKTKIVPGHGPRGDKSDLAKFHGMLITAQGRFQKLKASGNSVQQAVAAKPLADLDPVWGKGNFNGDAFVQIAYPTV